MSAAADPTGALKRRLAALPGRLRAEADAALRRIGDATVAEMRRALAAAGGPSPSHPGLAPRDADGDLAASLIVETAAAESVVRIGATSPHAVFLEYGTRTMAARPFLRPAVETGRSAAHDTCRAALAAAVRDEGRLGG